MSSTDDATRTALSRTLERYGASRELADGVVAKIRVVHLEPLLVLLDKHTPAHTVNVSLVPPTNITDTGIALWDPTGGAAPDIGTVIAHEDWILVRITRGEVNTGRGRTVLRGVCSYNGKEYSYYDSFTHENPEGKYNLDYLRVNLQIKNPKEFVGKEIYAQYVVKRGQGSVKKVSHYMTVEHYEAERTGDPYMVRDQL